MALISGCSNNILKTAFLCVFCVKMGKRTGGTDPKLSYDVMSNAVQE